MSFPRFLQYSVSEKRMPKRKAARQDAGSDEDDDGLGKREAELKRREEEISALQDTLKQREEELQKAEEEFSNEAAKAYGATKPDDIITLNVSGTKHQVLRSTLCYVEGSLLASMFSGRWDDSLVKDDQGAFFIDQPYEHFKALLDFFRSCKSATVSGPPASIADSGDVARNQRFMRMVDYYNCTPAVYPVEIKAVKEGAPKAEPKTTPYPNMSVEYHRHPEDGRDDAFGYHFSSIGHSRKVAKICFRLEGETADFLVNISGSGSGVFLLAFQFSFTAHEMAVQSRKGGGKLINVVEMNERCKRPMPTSTGTKAGDTIQCEFDTSSEGVRFRNVKFNGHLVFSFTDRPEDMFGDDHNDCILDSSYGSFSFCVEGKACITDVELA